MLSVDLRQGTGLMPSKPPRPRPDVHHGRLCWVTRWYGDPDPVTGKRPQYVQRWFDVDESEVMALYGVWLARWKSDPLMQDPRRAGDRMTVADLAVAYLRHAEQTFVKDGRITSHVYKVRTTLQLLVNHYGDLAAEDLDMHRLAMWRDALADGSRSRRYINDMLQIVSAAYRWAAERGEVSQPTCQAICSVSRLRKRRSNAREKRRVPPVAWQTVEETLPHLPPQVAAMVRVLWHTGMRPEEVCQMRGCDLDQSGPVWLYKVPSFKTDHLEGAEERIIPIGPQAQEAIKPFLKADLQEYLFNPKDTRKDGRYGEHYTTGSLRQAIHRACDAAWPPPPHLARQRLPAEGRKRWRLEPVKAWRQRLGPQLWAELQQWKAEHRWNPNQLRHAKASALRRLYGLEAARLVLGHKHVATTEIYADRDLQKCIEIARQTG